MISKKRKWLMVPVVLSLCLIMAVLILAKLSGRLLMAQIEKTLDGTVKANNVTMSWGGVTIEGLTFLRDGQVVGNVKSVSVKADLMGIFGKKIAISKISLDQPYFKLVVDHKGNLLLPVSLPKKRMVEERQERWKKGLQGDRAPNDTMPVEIKTIVVKAGRVELADRSLARPLLLQFEEMAVDVHNIVYPFRDQWTDFVASMKLAGGRKKGFIDLTGRTNPLREETRVKTTLHDIDLVLLRAYIEKKGDMAIERGSMTMNLEAGVVKKHLRAPGTMTIRDLRFNSSGGLGETFLGAPRSVVLSFLKNNSDEIRLDFVLEGDLSNPRFSLRENLATRLSVGLANRLGLSIRGSGETIAGGAARVVEGASRALKGLFGR